MSTTRRSPFHVRARPPRREALARLLAAAGVLASRPTAAGPASAPAAGSAPLPRVEAGRVERLADFPSRHVAARHVDVWLPPGYGDGQRHPVLYMHDGQMLFDPEHTWNRKAWRVDRELARLAAAGGIRAPIVVGPWNDGPRRRAEYFPQKALAHLRPAAARDAFVGQALLGRPLADAYLRFLVEELKPEIDRRFATRPGATDTFVMGSSMGGLISLYAHLEHPRVFGGAAALSTHWIGTFERNTAIPDALLAWLREALPAAGTLRLYLDRGTAGLDALYDEAQARVDALLRERGFAPPLVQTRVFDGAGHDEQAWQQRLEVPLQFLLGR